MNAVVSSNSEVDPFAEVEDDFAAVENLAKEILKWSPGSLNERNCRWLFLSTSLP